MKKQELFNNVTEGSPYQRQPKQMGLYNAAYEHDACGQDNVDIKYQLFYTPQGVLLKTRNVSDMYDILGPSTFLEN